MSSEALTESELRLSGQSQAEHRYLPLARDVEASRLFRIGQVQRLAVLAAINLGFFPPGLLHISAGLLENIIHIKPSLEMAAAEFALFVLLVTGTLIELFDLHFVLRKLRNLANSAGRSGQGFDLVAGLVVPDYLRLHILPELS